MKIKVNLEFSGGLELLIKGKQKNVSAEFAGSELPLKDLVLYVKDNLIAERSELFYTEGGVRPGILVLINDCDWELTGGIDTIVKDKDTVVFISTLHGG